MRTLRFKLDITATADGDQHLTAAIDDALNTLYNEALEVGDKLTVTPETGVQVKIEVLGYHQKWDFSDPKFFEEVGQSW